MTQALPPLRQSAFLVGLLVIGFLAGSALKRQATDSAAPNPHTDSPAPLRIRPDAANHRHPGAALPVAPINLRSDHTIEDLLNLPAEDLYDHFALWLVDASADDMSAYWNATKDHKDVSSKIRDLLFVRWTLTDPLGAIHASADTQSSHIPWWAWAKNDPAAAFEYATIHDRSRIEIVIQSIGQSDPKRALKLLTDHPELPQGTGFSGILFGLIRDDPEAAVKLASENPNFYDQRPMRAWIREDPHAAFHWYQANRASGSPLSGNRNQEFIQTLSAEYPELLGEFSSKLPHGALRRQFESAAFDHLVRSDPAKALEQARNNASSVIASEQLTKIALNLASDDPQQAKSLLTDILNINPNFAYRETFAYYPNGRSGGIGMSDDSILLIRTLVHTDPPGTLQQLIDAEPSQSLNSTTRDAAFLWVDRDPEAFADWTAAQPDSLIRNQGYDLLIDKLARSGNFESAIQSGC